MNTRIDAISKTCVEESISRIVARKFEPKISIPPIGYPYGYIVGFQQKWRGNSLTLYSLFKCDAPKAIFKDYEREYAKITWNSPDSYSLWYMRPKPKEYWYKQHSNLTLAEALGAIEFENVFHPRLWYTIKRGHEHRP